MLQKVINAPVLTHCIRDIDYSKGKYQEIQKLLLEVYLCLINLKEASEAKLSKKIESTLQCTAGISNAKRALKVVSEQTDFNFLRYFIHQASTPDFVLKTSNQTLGCMHPHFDVKIKAKFSVAEVERV